MREVYAEDDTMMYRRGIKRITSADDIDIESKVTERMKFCCEEKWKSYLRCMEGRTLSYASECVVQKEAADFCVGRIDKEKVKLGTQKKYVMGFLQSEARIRSAISTSEWRKQLTPDGGEQAAT